jgi:hypothetical protein
MKPYYEQDGITIYHGDCREALPDISANVLVTDPPWIASEKPLRFDRRMGGVGAVHHPAETMRYGKIGFFDLKLIRAAMGAVTHDRLVFAGYKELGRLCLASKPLRGVFGWQKPNAAPALFYPARLDLSFVVWSGEKSYLYGHQHWPSMVFSVSTPIPGCMATERFVDDAGRAKHPSQAPEKLLGMLLAPLPADAVILDCFMGTGTTLRAAKDLGRKAVGVEINERYCEVAAKRLAQGVLPLGAH